jgi:STE24 endopeptidase
LRIAPDSWWIWSWLFFSLYQVAALWLYPVLIAPMFNKYEPVTDDNLKNSIVSLVERAGFKTKAVLQVDAEKRSRHSNAYFTGLGRTKRIVLYDTLLASHSTDEILAILAHEIGHWKKKHIIKKLIFIEVVSFIIFYLIWLLLDWTLMYRTFGFEENLPYAGLFLLTTLAGPLIFFLKPVDSFVSRKYERQADDYTKDLIGSTRALSEALMRLAEDNLANLHPHPLYAWFYYSHPPLVDRIGYLQSLRRNQPSKTASVQ